MLRALRKLARVPARDWFELFRAQRALIAARRVLAHHPKGSLVALQTLPATSGAATAERLEDVLRVARGVTRAARFGLVRGTCLERSLAIMQRLQEEAIPGARVRVGVQRSEGTFAAHAWVEYAGRVVGDERRHVARYTILEDLNLLTPE